MITTSCDLACPGCDRFIDFNHSWHETLDELKTNMDVWARRIQPKRISLIGGEPLIHPNLCEIVSHTRQCFPDSIIEIFTNGILLNTQPHLIDTLIKNSPSFISITIHTQNQIIKDLINTNIKNFIQDKDIEFEISDATEAGWYDYRKTINNKTKPWNDNNPEKSYKSCGVKLIPIVYKNQLYKCPPISMLKTQATKYNFLNDPDWEPYLNYTGLNVDCSDEQLDTFVKNIFKPNYICGMCPASPVLKAQLEPVIKNKKLLK
jgi:organic radical activating enzyme